MSVPAATFTAFSDTAASAPSPNVPAPVFSKLAPLCGHLRHACGNRRRESQFLHVGASPCLCENFPRPVSGT